MSNPVKPTIKSEILPILLIVVSFALSFYFYANFPDQVPTHWNFAGEPDAYSGRAFAAFFFPLLLAGIYLMFLALPHLDPKKDRYEQFRKAYHVFKAMIVLIMFAIYLVTGLVGLGYDLNVGLWVPFAIGALFIILGNYMGKLKPNWFMGIRTPWTMSSEEVWNKTHRFGGKVFMLAGLIMMAMYFLPLSWQPATFIVMIASLLAGTVGYSYWVYYKLGKPKK